MIASVNSKFVCIIRNNLRLKQKPLIWLSISTFLQDFFPNKISKRQNMQIMQAYSSFSNKSEMFHVPCFNSLRYAQWNQAIIEFHRKMRLFIASIECINIQSDYTRLYFIDA